jgi:hypothetical protein
MKITVLYLIVLILVCAGCSKEQASAPESPVSTVPTATNDRVEAADFSQFPKAIIEVEILSSKVDIVLAMRSSGGKPLPCQEWNITRIKILSPERYAGEAQIYHSSSTVNKRWISKGEKCSIRMLDQYTLDSWAETKDDPQRNVLLSANRFEFIAEQDAAADAKRPRR